ncbi:hypothetical protein, partial [Scytonema hofmannii]|uniref:hypothetical protein n=1 Tax=Scytonema hofmannii TaxID=34078 RepID=UPI001A7E731A
LGVVLNITQYATHVFVGKREFYTLLPENDSILEMSKRLIRFCLNCDGSLLGIELDFIYHILQTRLIASLQEINKVLPKLRLCVVGD